MNGDLTVKELGQKIHQTQTYISSIIQKELEQFTKETGVEIDHVYVSLDKVNSLGEGLYAYLPSVELNWSISYE